MATRRNLLWIGDAECDSGFARATEYTLRELDWRLNGEFNCTVLGLNYLGDPHSKPYDVFPCWPGKDMFGVGRLETVVPKVRPDVIVIQNDPWNLPYYMEVLGETKIPVVAILAVDGKNCRGGTVAGKTAKDRGLNGLSLAIFWTDFGLSEARAGGYQGPGAVVPLGVDLEIYKPYDRETARQLLGLPLPEGAFLVGNVNRNQPRKRMDLTLGYFADWLRQNSRPDAYLFLHVAPTGENAYDLHQLSGYFGLKGRVLLSTPDAYKGLSQTHLAQLMSSFDVMISTTQGEGFGLPTLEGMACGVPQIVPRWSALEEWAGNAAMQIPCSTTACTFNGINVIGGIADRKDFVTALDTMYESAEVRALYRARGLARAKEDRFNWKNIGQSVSEVIQRTLWGKTDIRKIANG